MLKYQTLPKLITGIAIFTLVSCARQKQVWLTELYNAHQAHRQNVVRVYLDKRGNFYPDSRIYIPYKAFFDPFNKDNTTNAGEYSGNLDYYFTGRQQLRSGEYEHSKSTIFKTRSLQLAHHYNIDTTLAADRIFETSQDSILSGIMQSLNALLRQNPSKTLVVLIHGFNDPNPTGDYQMLRDNIYEHTKQEMVYLEIYWDGLTANQGSPPTSAIWGRAQYNSAHAAVAVRKILREVYPQYKIRVLTHSLGASVGTGTLFNCTTKWSEPQSIKKHQQMVDNTPAPEHQDIRLGMLAPAIPGVTTFSDFNHRNWPGKECTNNIHTIVVGYNHNDYAVTKRVWGKDYLSGWSLTGSTSLGANRKDEVDKARNILVDSGYADEIDQLYIPVNFSIYPNEKKEEEHGAYYYMQRTVAMQKFLSALFD
ncbi:MAG: hypothetical protein ACPF9D_04650 [Owenweeksia sp.]